MNNHAIFSSVQLDHFLFLFIVKAKKEMYKKCVTKCIYREEMLRLIGNGKMTGSVCLFVWNIEIKLHSNIKRKKEVGDHLGIKCLHYERFGVLLT